MTDEYWLDDRAWAAIGPLLQKNRPGARRVDDRRVISGILFVLRSGCRWKDCPAVYGPHTTTTIAGTVGVPRDCGRGCFKRWRMRDRPGSP
jgi:transposase